VVSYDGHAVLDEHEGNPGEATMQVVRGRVGCRRVIVVGGPCLDSLILPDGRAQGGGWRTRRSCDVAKLRELEDDATVGSGADNRGNRGPR